MSVNYMYQLELLGWEGLDSPEGTTAYSKHHSCLNMPFDQDLRRQFETLTDRLRDEVTRQLAIATGELTASQFTIGADSGRGKMREGDR